MLPVYSRPDLNPDWDDLQHLQAQAEAEGRQCLVGGLIINAQGRVFAMKRSPDRRLFPGCWDIPGGHVEPGETLYQALEREMREETGWQLERITALADILDWQVERDGQTSLMREFDFIVQVSGDLTRPQIEQDKFTDCRWIGPDDLDMLRQNRREGDWDIGRLVAKVWAARPDTVSEGNKKSG